MLVHLLSVPAPVLNTRADHPGVDEVEKIVAVSPIQLEIVNFERHVVVNPRRLDGSEVDTDHAGSRVSLGEIESPDSGTGTAVENVGGIFLAEGSEVESAGEDEKLKVMREVKTVLLGFIGRKHVLFLLGLAVVAAACGRSSVIGNVERGKERGTVGIDMLLNAGREGLGRALAVGDVSFPYLGAEEFK